MSRAPVRSQQGAGIFIKRLRRRQEVVEIFATVHDSDRVSVDEFKQWLAEKQGVAHLTHKEVTDLVRELMADFASANDEAQEPVLTVDGFHQYLLMCESHADLVDRRKVGDVYQDMTRPLCDYWIASSHNTYLSGDQLRSASSVDMYRSALLNGCRCVEIDVWDGPNGEPIVWHGKTLTSKILFADVLQTIAEHAFTVSPYPLIISLENHCGFAQQRRMGELLADVLRGMLHPPFSMTQSQLASPHDLRHKILIKAKVLGDRVAELLNEVPEADDDDDHEHDEKPNVNELLGPLPKPPGQPLAASRGAAEARKNPLPTPPAVQITSSYEIADDDPDGDEQQQPPPPPPADSSDDGRDAGMARNVSRPVLASVDGRTQKLGHSSGANGDDNDDDDDDDDDGDGDRKAKAPKSNKLAVPSIAVSAPSGGLDVSSDDRSGNDDESSAVAKSDDGESKSTKKKKKKGLSPRIFGSPRKLMSSLQSSMSQSSKKDDKKLARLNSAERGTRQTPDELARLVSLRAVAFPPLEAGERASTEAPCWHMSSLPELRLEKLARSHAEELVRYNQRQMSRVYPKVCALCVCRAPRTHSARRACASTRRIWRRWWRGSPAVSWWR